MHKEILTTAQIRLLPLIEQFKKNFYLAGDTAIALYIGHRQSIDFDLFTKKEFENSKIKKIVSNETRIDRTVRDEEGQYTIIANGVHITFFQYSFAITARSWLNQTIKMPDILTLAAMKAYALGRRAKWKDYVDLYFIIKKYHGISIIADKAKTIFGKEFNEKLFREQLSYFKDINRAEKLVYMHGFKIEDKIVERELTKFSLQ